MYQGEKNEDRPDSIGDEHCHSARHVEDHYLPIVRPVACWIVHKRPQEQNKQEHELGQRWKLGKRHSQLPCRLPGHNFSSRSFLERSLQVRGEASE